MQVRLLGFNFNVDSKNLTLDGFLDAISTNSNNPKVESESHRLLLLDNKCHMEYHVGLIVTVKDQKTFCQLVSGNGSLSVKVDALGLNTKLMEFNFFVINKTTGMGLYQHYHQSCSLSSFGNLVGKHFLNYREKLIQNAIDNLPKEENSESSLSSIRKQYKGQFKLETLVRKERLEDLIAELKRVKSFEWNIATPTVDLPDFKPLAPYIRNKKSKLLFTVGTPVNIVAKSISSAVSDLGISKGRIEGTDIDGLNRVLRIFNNPENYGEYDYDDLAGKLNELDLSKFQEAWIVSELISACRKQSYIFETPMRP